MSLLLDSWLAAFQPLPIEGVGTFQWERSPASRQLHSSLLQGPEWTLIFHSDNSITLPTNFFQRLASFGNQSAEEAALQYKSWLRRFQMESFQVTILDQGELRKQIAEPAQWYPHPLATSPEADLKSVPFSASYLYRRWDIPNKIVAALTILAFVSVLFIFLQAGWSPGTTRSQLPASLQTNDMQSLPFLEIR